MSQQHESIADAVTARLNKHPVIAAAAILGTLLTLPQTLLWYADVLPASVACGLTLLVVGTLVAAFRYSRERIVNEIHSPAKVQCEPVLIPELEQPAIWKECEVEGRHKIPPEAHARQHLFRAAYELLESKDRTSTQSIAKAAQLVREWVEKQCYLLLDAYPGVPEPGLKARYYEMAHRKIKSGALVNEPFASELVTAVDRFVHSNALTNDPPPKASVSPAANNTNTLSGAENMDVNHNRYHSRQLTELAISRVITLTEHDKSRITPTDLANLAISRIITLNQFDKNRIAPQVLADLAISRNVTLNQLDKDRIGPATLMDLAISRIIQLSDRDKSRLDSNQLAMLQTMRRSA